MPPEELKLSKIVIFGNSGSGKSTLAKQLCAANSLTHFDLDTIAWQASSPPVRKALTESKQDIDTFLSTTENWVIEGCYSDLLELIIPAASEIIFLNLSIEDCISNAKNRPWEPHKYASKADQDANLNMLLGWIAQYTERDDSFSQGSHEALFNCYQGKKTMYTHNSLKTA